MRVISFCVHGQDPRQRAGLLRNLDHLPEGFIAWVYAGCDVDEGYIEQLRARGGRVERRPHTGARLRLDRLLPLDHPEVDLCFVRNAAGRIRERDRWCMREFEASAALFHVIRDHATHRARIRPGCCGGKRGCLPDLQAALERWTREEEVAPGADRAFFEQVVYPRVEPLIHTNCVAYRGEQTQPIPLEETDDFAGNLYDADDQPLLRRADYPFAAHIRFLQSEDQWRLIAHNLPLDRAEGDLLFALFQAYYYLERYADAQAVLARCRVVDEHVIVQSSHLIAKLAPRVVGTTDVDRAPAEDEVVVVYGSFPHDIHNLPCSKRIFRHAIYSRCIRHSEFEHHRCWDPVGQIYLLNLKHRFDRFAETMTELARIDAPLDRVLHFEAEPAEDPLIGVTENHVAIIRHFLASGHEICAVFEDDFTFTSRVARHQQDLATFWDRGYAFDVCLLSTSKYGERRPHDDLLELSFQECTTAAGYLLHRSTAQGVLDVMEEGLQVLRAGDTQGAVDRYWARLQVREKFFVFATRFGYQRCGYSDLRGAATAYFN